MRYSAVSLCLVLGACAEDPVALSDSWILGSWQFAQGACWPANEPITPGSLGYELTFMLSLNGRAEIRHDDVIVDRLKFKAAWQTDPTYGSALVLEFETDAIFSLRELIVHDESNVQRLVLVTGGLDGCGFIFQR